jgi:hypothetical protein
MAKETKETKIEFRVAKDKNFVGFVHPETRRFVTAQNKKFFVDESDEKAIAILRAAVDIVEI